jgi:hypothetical protein
MTESFEPHGAEATSKRVIAGMADKSVIDSLIANPSESLSVELKRWIDPTQADPCLSLRLAG